MVERRTARTLPDLGPRSAIFHGVSAFVLVSVSLHRSSPRGPGISQKRLYLLLAFLVLFLIAIAVIVLVVSHVRVLRALQQHHSRHPRC